MAFLHCECGFEKEDVPDSHIGKKVKCPKCKQSVVIRTTDSKPPLVDQPATAPVSQSEPEFNANQIRRQLIKCPGCDLTYLAEPRHYIDVAGITTENDKNQGRTGSKKRNRTFIGIVGVSLLLVAILFAFFSDHIMTYFKKEPPVKFEALSAPDFSDFIVKFFTDKEFQIEHTQFPFRFETLYSTQSTPEVKALQKSDWSYEDLSWLKNECCFVQYYYDFNYDFDKLQESKSMDGNAFYELVKNDDKRVNEFLDDNNERVLGFHDEMSMAGPLYFFKLIDNKWMLLKVRSLVP